MVIVMRKNLPKEEIESIVKKLVDNHDVKIHESKGENYHLLGVVGDTSTIDTTWIEANRLVEKLIRIQSPYKKASIAFRPEDTVIDIDDHKIGGENFGVIAGPCSIEGHDAIIDLAQKVKESGAHFLRGGAFKPRTSPYSFQGLGEEGIELLNEAKAATGLPVVSEIMAIDKIEYFVENVDIIQVGARNMQNFMLLKELGKTNKPILLKRGLSATIEELLMSAEYIMSGGNNQVVLCERGIRTFERYTRNTLDISAVPVLKKLSHLPVIVDPSHASGEWWLVEPLAKAALAVGADGIMIEVHQDPQNAKSDGQQSIKPSRFDDLMGNLKSLSQHLNKKI
ncbi:MAG: 3-deoxy-7-phosphoheptulonate synthase [Clostridia bacterium]|nr:3-deoxy-7-phosphoheptulonate synthase [Clostridia bacterium]